MIEHNKGGTQGKLWADFWAGNTPIYVNARHAAIHYDRIAADLTALLAGRVRPRVLDWGCGDAFGAPALARVSSELLLYDAVSAVQQRLFSRLASTTGIRVLDDSAWRELPAASVDVIVMNSVAQYLSRADLGRVLTGFRRVVSDTGEVLLADIIPSDAGLLLDINALLMTGARHGFFVAACLGLVRTWFSDYRHIRQRAGFSVYTASEIVDFARQQRFSAERLPANIGFNRQRMTFRLRPV